MIKSGVSIASIASGDDREDSSFISFSLTKLYPRNPLEKGIESQASSLRTQRYLSVWESNPYQYKFISKYEALTTKSYGISRGKSMRY